MVVPATVSREDVAVWSETLGCIGGHLKKQSGSGASEALRGSTVKRRSVFGPRRSWNRRLFWIAEPAVDGNYALCYGASKRTPKGAFALLGATLEANGERDFALRARLGRSWIEVALRAPSAEMRDAWVATLATVVDVASRRAGGAIAAAAPPDGGDSDGDSDAAAPADGGRRLRSASADSAASLADEARQQLLRVRSPDPSPDPSPEPSPEPPARSRSPEGRGSTADDVTAILAGIARGDVLDRDELLRAGVQSRSPPGDVGLRAFSRAFAAERGRCALRDAAAVVAAVSALRASAAAVRHSTELRASTAALARSTAELSETKERLVAARRESTALRAAATVPVLPVPWAPPSPSSSSSDSGRRESWMDSRGEDAPSPAARPRTQTASQRKVALFPAISDDDDSSAAPTPRASAAPDAEAEHRSSAVLTWDDASDGDAADDALAEPPPRKAAAFKPPTPRGRAGRRAKTREKFAPRPTALGIAPLDGGGGGGEIAECAPARATRGSSVGPSVGLRAASAILRRSSAALGDSPDGGAATTRLNDAVARGEARARAATTTARSADTPFAPPPPTGVAAGATPEPRRRSPTRGSDRRSSRDADPRPPASDGPWRRARRAVRERRLAETAAAAFAGDRPIAKLPPSPFYAPPPPPRAAPARERRAQAAAPPPACSALDRTPGAAAASARERQRHDAAFALRMRARYVDDLEVEARDVMARLRVASDVGGSDDDALGVVRSLKARATATREESVRRAALARTRWICAGVERACACEARRLERRRSSTTSAAAEDQLPPPPPPPRVPPGAGCGGRAAPWAQP